MSLSHIERNPLGTNMLIRTGLWTLEAAKSWLRNYEWGNAIANTIDENADPRREAAWICMVMDIEAVVSGSHAVQADAPPPIPCSVPPTIDECPTRPAILPE